LRADVLAAGAGINLFTTMDLGSCAPPVRAGRAYRISVWYQSTGPLSFASYLRRPQGSYASFGAAVVFPPAATWTRASWVTLVTPDLEHMALSLGITAAETGTYLVDDLSVRLVRPTPLAGSTGSGPREESPAAPPGGSPASGGSKGATVGGDGAGRRAAPRSGAKAGSQSVTNRAEVHEETPFRPTDAQSVVPLAESRDNGSQLSGRPPWWDFLQMGIALLAAFGMIVLLDRRFGHLHARTRQLLEARRSAPSTSR
jgi:hypothetical protein